MGYIALIEGLVNEKCFYFSYNYNLTHTLQKNVNTILKTDQEESKGLEKKGSADDYWQQFDTKLVFNRIM